MEITGEEAAVGEVSETEGEPSGGGNELQPLSIEIESIDLAGLPSAPNRAIGSDDERLGVIEAGFGGDAVVEDGCSRDW